VTLDRNADACGIGLNAYAQQQYVFFSKSDESPTLYALKKPQ
jgi:hypothetical protein